MPRYLRCHWLCSEADFEQIEKHTEHCAGSNISSPALIDQMCNAGRGRRRGDIVISRWTIESGPGISTISAELVDTGTILKIEPRGSFAKSASNAKSKFGASTCSPEKANLKTTGMFDDDTVIDTNAIRMRYEYAERLENALAHDCCACNKLNRKLDECGCVMVRTRSTYM